MRLLSTLLLASLSASACAQALPDAPSSSMDTLLTQVADADGGQPVLSSLANPLPLVNGRHYRPVTEGERFGSFAKGLVSPGAFGGALYSATYRQLRDRPDPKYWNTDAEGFGKRFGAAYGQRVINSGTRYTFGALLHEDNRYLICHGCTFKEKLKNALLADFTARHGADGHKTLSPTGILSGFSGALVAYAYWYPQQDPNFGVRRGPVVALYGFGTRPAAHFASEILDGHKIPFLHRRFGDGNPRQKEQVPVGWTGPLPPKHRSNPAVPDVPGSYADPTEPGRASKR